MMNYYGSLYNNETYSYNEDLDLYTIKNIVRMETKKYGSVNFYELLSMVKENCYGAHINSATLEESLEFMHDYGFGIIFDGTTVYYDYELDSAA